MNDTGRQAALADIIDAKDLVLVVQMQSDKAFSRSIDQGSEHLKNIIGTANALGPAKVLWKLLFFNDEIGINWLQDLETNASGGVDSCRHGIPPIHSLQGEGQMRLVRRPVLVSSRRPAVLLLKPTIISVVSLSGH